MVVIEILAVPLVDATLADRGPISQALFEKVNVCPSAKFCAADNVTTSPLIAETVISSTIPLPTTESLTATFVPPPFVNLTCVPLLN